LFTFPRVIQAMRDTSTNAQLLKDMLKRPFKLENGTGFFNMLLAVATSELSGTVDCPEILIVILLLAFPLYGRDVTDRGFFAHFLKDQEVASNLTQLSVATEDDEVLEFETALQLVNAMRDEDLTVVANVLGTLMLANGFKRCKFIYSFVITLVGNGRSPNCFVYFVECAETDQENVFLKNSLIEILDGLKTGRAAGDRQSMSKFPVVQIEESIVPVKKAVDFTTVRDFPPLYISDPEFRDCPTVRAVEHVVKAIAVEPMVRWFAEIAAVKETRVDPALSGVQPDRLNSSAIRVGIQDAFKAGMPVIGDAKAQGQLLVIGDEGVRFEQDP
jgi:hypothetical protein